MGVIIEDSRRQDADINERIVKINRVFHAIKNKFINKKEISRKTKMIVFKTLYVDQSSLTGMNPGC